MTVSTEYLCWLAGFFDGEGSVSIGVNHYKLVNAPFKGKRYHLRINIVQNIKEVLEEIKGHFGGCLKLQKVYYANLQRPIYNLAIDAHKAREFLTAVYPHLKVKRKQAEVGIAFQDMLNASITSLERREKGIKFKEEVESINSAKVWVA